MARSAHDTLTVTTWLTARERHQVEAANCGCLRFLHRDTATALSPDLAAGRAEAALVSAALIGRDARGSVAALVSVLTINGLHYLNSTAAKFNHDVIQLPFWALAGFAFHRALRVRQLAYWLLLGLALGISLWAKYFVLVLAAPLALFFLVDRDARKGQKPSDHAPVIGVFSL